MKEFKTIKDIVKFFVENKHSDEMKIGMSSMKLLMKIYENPDINLNFFIGFNDLYAKKCEIFVRELKYDKDKKSLDLNKIVMEDHPILAYREDKKDYVLRDIEINDEVFFDYSEISNQIRQQYRDSKEVVDKFNL